MIVAALRRWVPLLAVAALLGVAALAASFSAPEFDVLPAPTQQESAQPPAGAAQGSAPPASIAPSPTPPRTATPLPSWVAALVEGLCVALVVVLVGLLVWHLVRTRIGAGTAPAPVAEGAPPGLALRGSDVVAAVDAGLDELSDRDVDPRRAVIACWVRLERAAAAAGTPRQPGDTPTDLVRRLLSAHRVSRPVLDSFADVYRQARYATRTVDESMRAVAVSALSQVRAEIASGPAGVARPDDGAGTYEPTEARR